MTANVLIASSFFLALVALSFWRRGEGTGQTYLIGDRKVGIFRTATALVAGFRDGAGLSAWVALSIAFGFGAMWLWIGLAAALVAVSVIAPKIRARAATANAYSLSSWLEAEIGSLTGRIATFVIAATAFLYAAAQFAVAAHIAGSLFGIGALVAVAAVSLTICTYIAIGGYLSVIRTDVFQWAIITIVCLTIPVQLAGGMPHLPSAETLFSPPLLLGIGLFAVAFLVTFSGADTWQRVMSTPSDRAARRSPLLAALLYFLISIALVVFGYNIGLAYPSVPPAQAFTNLFSILEQSSLIWGALGLLVAASAISTIDTQVYLFASALAPSFASKTEVARQIVLVRILSLVFTLATGAIALTVGDIVEFLFSAVTLITVLGPVILLVWRAPALARRSDIVVTTAIGLATLVYAAMFAVGLFANVILTMVPAVVCAIVLGAGLLFAKADRSPES